MTHNHTPGHSHTFAHIADDRLRRFATMASITVALSLIAAKTVGYLLTDSVSMLSSLFDSAIDLMASLVTAFGVAKAMAPPDRNHRYGHGKAEPLAAFSQVAFIIGSSAYLAIEAVRRLYQPQPISHEITGYVIMGVSILATLLLVAFQHHVVRRTGSVAIHADSLHYVGDFAINLAVVVSFLLRRFTGIAWFDPLFGFCIAMGLFIPAVKILRHALHALMDTELPESERDKITGIALTQPGVVGIHDMRTRTDGDRIFIDLHAEMDGNLTLWAAHDLAEKISGAIVAVYANADVIIHQEPAGLIEERRDQQIEDRALS